MFTILITYLIFLLFLFFDNLCFVLKGENAKIMLDLRLINDDYGFFVKRQKKNKIIEFLHVRKNRDFYAY